jgi:hypothetical protein
MRDGTVAEDPRLDRLVQFDEKSRAFGIMEALDVETPRGWSWFIPRWFDQGREGQCVIYAKSHWVAGRPKRDLAAWWTKDWATQRYWDAQRIDPWEGGEYPGASPRYGGTSVLAGVKVMQTAGLVGEYRWAFGAEQLAIAVSRHAPAVIGVNWYDSMYDTDSKGLLTVGGSQVGGHAICVRGYSVKHRMFRLRNSWSQAWGLYGDCFITYDDMARLLHEDGEAALPARPLTVPA